MKFFPLTFLFFLIACVSPLSARMYDKDVMNVSFEQSMALLRVKYQHLSLEQQQMWKTFAALYHTHRVHRMVKKKKPLIPLKIHQIWIGSEVPEELISNCIRWQKIHPNWEYKLWVDADLADFHLVNQYAFDQAGNYGEKADIWRYEILDRFVGLYVDMDMYCVQPFDFLHYCYDFFAGISNVDSIEVNNALIACAPGHPIIQACIKNISTKKTSHAFQQTIEKTGPLYFTKIFIDYIRKTKYHKAIALPVSFFYPLPNTFQGPQSEEILKQWIKPETFSVHLWECRWMRPSGIVNQTQVK